MLQVQAAKKEDSDLLLRALNSKVDIQGQRLQMLESDLKYVKELLENNSQAQNMNQNSAIATVSCEDKLSEVFSFKKDIIQTINTSSNEVKTQVSNEVKKVINACKNRDATAKVFEVEKIVTEVASEMKQVVTGVGDLERGIRAVENSTNRYSFILQDIIKNSKI